MKKYICYNNNNNINNGNKYIHVQIILIIIGNRINIIEENKKNVLC